jgi:hypothetical protein
MQVCIARLRMAALVGPPSARLALLPTVGDVRNTGWYIPFWRKPKRTAQEQPSGERGERRRRPRNRSEQELDRVRDDWVRRYNAQARSLRVLGLSVGAPKADIEARYQALIGELNGDLAQQDRLDEIRAAYEQVKLD